MLSGYKTYITGGIGAALALLGMFGWLPAGISIPDPATLLESSFAAMFIRAGIASTAGK